MGRHARQFDLLPVTVVTAAGTYTSPVYRVQDGLSYLSLQGSLVYGSGGTTIKAYIQTSVDGGATWRDVANLAFAQATLKKFSAVSAFVALAAAQAVSDAALADDTIMNGLLGDQWRVKYVVVGTYAGNTTLQVSAVSQP